MRSWSVVVSEGRIGVLVSGRGSNMEAIAVACKQGQIPARIALVVSNEPGAAALARASRHGIETLVIDHRESRSREEHDRRIAAALDEKACGLVCLAGYMRLLSGWFVSRYAGRIMNIHPSLLPAFPGLDAQRQAIEHGAKISGVSVHFVDEQLDHGPIILQAAVLVRDDDTEDSLSSRILVEEHKLYPEAVRLFFEDRLRIQGRRVHVLPARGGGTT
jgi:phosphoribosylglycinamide formyltransferase-1